MWICKCFPIFRGLDHFQIYSQQGKITLRLNWSQLLQQINEGHKLKLLLLRNHCCKIPICNITCSHNVQITHSGGSLIIMYLRTFSSALYWSDSQIETFTISNTFWTISITSVYRDRVQRGGMGPSKLSLLPAILLKVTGGLPFLKCRNLIQTAGCCGASSTSLDKNKFYKQ